MNQNSNKNRHKILSLLQEGFISVDEAKSKIIMEQKYEDDGITNHRLNSIQKADIDVNDDVAIIGISGRFPGADNLDEFWYNLTHGVNSVEEIPETRWEGKNYYDPDFLAVNKSYSKFAGLIDTFALFEPLFYNISPKEAELMDPQHRLFLEETWKAIEDAGYAAKDLDNKKCSVYVGYGEGDYKLKLQDEKIEINSYYFTGNAGAILPARISYLLNLKGEAISLDTACSSSLVALHLACQSIRNGADMAIAGGVTTLTTPVLHILASKASMLSPDGKCKAFDDTANGFVPAEGVGVVVLKKYRNALRDRDHIYAVIKGSAINQDGRTNGITAPNGASQTELECELYDTCKISPETVSYVEAHGTGTKLGDPIEVNALTDAFRKYTDKKQFCAIGSVKTNIGHAQLASGMAGLIKILLCIKHRMLVPSLHYSKSNEHIDFIQSPFFVNTELMEWVPPAKYPRRALLSAFGFSGTNVHVFIEENTKVISAGISGKNIYSLLPISAKSEEALKKKLQELYEWLLSNHDHCSFEEIIFTQHIGRNHYEFRTVFIVNSKEDILRQLEIVIKNNYEALSVTQLNFTGKQQINDNARIGNLLIDEVLHNEPNDDSGFVKMKKLAGFYQEGVDLDWDRLYQLPCYRRISMPTYPFRKEFYLAHRKESDLLAQKITIGENVVYQHEVKSKDDLLYSVSVLPKDFYVLHHVVNNDLVLPGVMYLEIISKILTTIITNGNFVIRSVTFLQPLIFFTEAIQIFVSLVRNHDRYRVEVYTFGHGKEKILHVQAGVVFDVTKAKQDGHVLDVNSIRQSCSLHLDADQHYKYFQVRGMHHGVLLQGVRNLHYFPKQQVLGEIIIPAMLDKSFEQYVLHPTVLDSACQVIIGLLTEEERNANELYLPFSLGEIRILEPIKKNMLVYATEIMRQENKTEVKHYRILLADIDGRVCVILDDFVLRKIKVSTEKVIDEQARLNMGKILLAEPQWVEKSAVLGARQDKGKVILVFDIENDFVRQMRLSVAKNSAHFTIVLVNKGVRYTREDMHSFTIDPQDQADYEMLFSALSSSNLFPSYIINLWLPQTYPNNLIGLQQQLEFGFYSTFYFLQRIIQNKINSDIQLFFLDIRCSDDFSPAVSSMYGLGRCLQMEHPNIQTKIIVVNEVASLSEITELFIRELPVFETQVVRYGLGQKREVLVFKEKSCVLPTEIYSSLIYSGSVYLVIGGLGGIGKHICRELLQNGKAKVIILGRSELDLNRKNVLKQLETYGGEVTYLVADTSDEGRMNEVLKEIREKHGTINGIIYCAVVQKDALIGNKNIADIDLLFKAKIHGVWCIDHLTKQDKLDFFLLFSSVTGILGNIGQADYCYANCFLDNFALWRNMQKQKGLRYGKTLSIDWPLLSDGGMSLPSEKLRFLEKTFGIQPLDTSAVIELLKFGLNAFDYQMVVLKGQLDKLTSLLSISSGKQGNVLKKEHEKEPSSHEQGIAGQLQKDLIGLLSAQMKIDSREISVDKKLYEYGFDSISLTEFSNKINEKYDADIMPSIFFEFDTLRLISDQLMHQYSEKFKLYYQQLSSSFLSSHHGSLKREEIKVPVQVQLLHGSKVSSDSIAIIGMNGIMPRSNNLHDFWGKLVAGFDFVTEIPKERWDWEEIYGDPRQEENKTNIKWGAFLNCIDKFDAKFFNISPREAALMDPQQRLFLNVVWSVIEDAGYRASQLAGTKTGLFVGVSTLDFADMLTRQGIEIDAYTSTGRAHSVLANRVSYIFDFHGPSEPIDTACSSSLVSIHRAIEAIQSGSCEMAVAGGVNLMLSPELYVAFSKASMLSPDGSCKTFDASANGYVRGEGVGAVLLKPLSKAQQDKDNIYAVIRGSSVNHGGRANSLTAPNTKAQKDLLVDVYKKANISPRTISYIETHGTGTRLGDPVEIEALISAFATLNSYFNESKVVQPYCGVGAIKSNIGHLEAAAGIAGIIKILLAFKYKTLPPNIHFKKLNPYIKLDASPFYIVDQAREWVALKNYNNEIIPRRAGISSFGFGGSNAHIILEEYYE